jgi:hypothetical protein
MTVQYTVASERAGELRSKSTRATARVPRRVPAGTSHALAPDATTTVCGLPATTLELFPDLVWADGSFLARCHDCRRLMSAA